MATPGNAELRGARQALGLRSQAALADAVSRKAHDLGLNVTVTERTVRRWESTNPPWPDPDRAQALEAVLHRPVTELGFTPPWDPDATSTTPQRRPSRAVTALPSTAAADYLSATVAYRHLYWTLPAQELHPVVSAHAALGTRLLARHTTTTVVTGAAIQLATATAESNLLAGRLSFFDLNTPDTAQRSFVAALQSAQHAADNLLGAAALAHLAFIPAFAGTTTRSDEARDHLRAARAFARRGDANPTILAWLDAVDAEVETRFGDTDRALSLLHRAEQRLLTPDTEAATDPATPAWFDWFSADRLAGFVGNTLINAGKGKQAHEALVAALETLPDDAAKQRSVLLADLAAASVLEGSLDHACEYLSDALDALAGAWYAAGMNRVKDVRSSMRDWDAIPAVRDLDERLYNWATTVPSLDPLPAPGLLFHEVD